MEEAINQLQDLGITRTQAKKALARYNNDVSRAADYIFSGNYISEDEEETNLVQEALTTHDPVTLSLEEQSKHTQTASSQSTTTDQSNLSLVVYKDPREAFDQQVPSKNTKATSDFSLTWWSNPENPSERKAIDNLPIGLRPPAYSFNYAPIIIQALFHVTYFQLAVISYRPVPSDWGTPENYWKGKGEPIPGYITVKKMKTKQPGESNDKETEKPENEKTEDYNDIDESCIKEDLVENSQEESVTEVKAIPKCLQVLGELQKTFAFLGNTKRSYGSIANFTKTLSTKSNYWDEEDVHFESFLELLINNIIGCDELSDTSLSLSKSFKSLDPLVFESYKSDDDPEITYKFTSFEKASPLVFIVLENRDKLDYEYRIDSTIYLDRYMRDNKDKAIHGFQKMQAYQMDIKSLQAEVDRLKGDVHSMSKSELLDQSIIYFKENEDAERVDMDALVCVLETVKQKMSDKLNKTEYLLKERKKEVYKVFDTEDMKNRPYNLRATFHHDGKNGTGHYWAYIWVEAKQENLLENMPTEGGWFKFCDAQVTLVKEEDMFNDPVPPFSLMYVDGSLPKYTKQQLYEGLPDELKEFIKKENELFEQEISKFDRANNLSYPVYEDVWTTEKTEEYQIENTAFDDTNSIGTAVGQTNTETENQKYLGQRHVKLKEQTNRRIVEASTYSCDDYRMLMNFEAFLAKTQNQQGLEHLYLMYLQEPDENGVQKINEETSKNDEDLKFAWSQYEYLLSLSEKVTQALNYFVKKEYQMALQTLLDTKRTEIAWKTQVMMNLDLHAYSSIDAISFNPLYETYGKECLEILNKAAFNKALNVSYRSRGLEDALRIAHQAHAIIGPDAISNDSTYESLRELWLNFGEQDNTDKLTDTQTDLLNTLVMTYLEGQSGQSIDPMDRTPFPGLNINEKSKEFPLWVQYKQAYDEAETLLKQNHSK
ncbi:hypothetical protein G6F56_001715 [Rhizopus delemar]|nr:hypothetical protein G6F56_001715 [Rhizopus delemar]